MRVAPYLLSAILLAAMFGTTHAAPTTIEGSWERLRHRQIPQPH